MDGSDVLSGLDLFSVEYFNNSIGVVFSTPSSSVFREDEEVAPVPLCDGVAVMPWGADNQMPFRILDLVESDETVTTCQEFQSEVCYGSGLDYDCSLASDKVAAEVDDFLTDNSLPSYFLGVAKDFKYFGFAVSVLILDRSRTHIVRLVRKEACYCRFAPKDDSGRIPYVVYAQWRRSVPTSFECIPLLDMDAPWSDLKNRVREDPSLCKFAVVSRVPTVDSTYYPIPAYASLFKGKWYDIKRNIGLAKDAKLRNSAALKYHIQVSQKYWEKLIRDSGATDKVAMQEVVLEAKRQMVDYLTGAENSGKAIFSEFWVSPDGREQPQVKIERIDVSKEGGDYESDIQEAVNMICFTMRVHSNLVGSVPGKAQSNNSGSDKRELYTIAHALQKPYHDILFMVHKLIIKFNSWTGVKPVCPFMQLTTLDEHKDAKEVSMDRSEGGSDA